MDFNEVTTVELVTTETEPQFLVTQKDEKTFIVPADPTNRHFIEIQDWYDKQKKKPFKYDFKKNKPE
jgi:hypothetical protein